MTWDSGPCLGFERTGTGYRATDEQIAWWNCRDTCPACSAVAVPVRRNVTGGTPMWEYECRCEPGPQPVRWSREVAAGGR